MSFITFLLCRDWCRTAIRCMRPTSFSKISTMTSLMTLETRPCNVDVMWTFSSYGLCGEQRYCKDKSLSQRDNFVECRPSNQRTSSLVYQKWKKEGGEKGYLGTLGLLNGAGRVLNTNRKNIFRKISNFYNNKYM